MMCVADDSTPSDIKTKNATTDLTVLQHGMYDSEPATKVKLCPKTGMSSTYPFQTGNQDIT